MLEPLYYMYLLRCSSLYTHPLPTTALHALFGPIEHEMLDRGTWAMSEARTCFNHRTGTAP